MEEVRQAQRKAARMAGKAAEKIDRTLSTGEGLNRATRRFERVFGKDSGTRQTMARVSADLRAMAEVLRDDGSGGHWATGLSMANYMAAGGSTDGMAMAPIGGPGVIVNLGHPQFASGTELRWTAAHESAHNVGNRHGLVNGVVAYRRGTPAQQQAFEALPTMDALTNPDHLVKFLW